MITLAEYGKQIGDRKPINRIRETYWWSEDYVIDNLLMRYSGVRKINRQTLEFEFSEFVHVNNMGVHV